MEGLLVFLSNRCSESASVSQISLFLEEPTTCNYVLTVEATFLCPLLHNTDEFGLFSWSRGAGLEPEGAGLSEEMDAQYEDEMEYDDDGNVKSDPESADPDSDSDDRKKSQR